MVSPDEKVPPGKIIPPHEIAFAHYVAELALDMRRRGWRGRPLLVEVLSGTRYKAWTGSHRVAAATLVKLPEVPVVFVDIAALKFLGRRRRPETVFCGGKIDLQNLPPAGTEVRPALPAGALPVRSETYLADVGGDQEDWRDILRHVKDKRGADLLSYEIRLNRRQWKRNLAFYRETAEWRAARK